MCDHIHFDELEDRVDNLDKRVAVIETNQNSMRQEMKTGFSDLKQNLDRFYAERTEWSKWLRDNLPTVGKFIGKWVVILTITAIGVNRIPDIIDIIKNWSL